MITSANNMQAVQSDVQMNTKQHRDREIESNFAFECGIACVRHVVNQALDLHCIKGTQTHVYIRTCCMCVCMQQYDTCVYYYRHTYRRM